MVTLGMEDVVNIIFYAKAYSCSSNLYFSFKWNSSNLTCKWLLNDFLFVHDMRHIHMTAEWPHWWSCCFTMIPYCIFKVETRNENRNTFIWISSLIQHEAQSVDQSQQQRAKESLLRVGHSVAKSVVTTQSWNTGKRQEILSRECKALTRWSPVTSWVHT